MWYDCRVVDSPENPAQEASIQGELAARTERLRADGVEKIMDSGFPREGEPGSEHYERIWGQVDRYVGAVRADHTLNEQISSYLLDPENARAFSDVIGRLKSGEAPADFAAAEEENIPNRRYLSAMVALEGVVKGALRTEGGVQLEEHNQRRDADLVGAEGEAARRFVRVTEILGVEGTSVMIQRGIHPLAMEEVGDDYAARFDWFAQRRDVPEIYRERARVAASNLRIDAMKAEGDGKTVQNAASQEKLEAAGPPPEGFVTEQLFGREGGVKAKDVEGIKNHLEGLLAQPMPKNAFEAARILAHAKRAGIRLTGGRGKMGEFLQLQREEIQKRGPRAFAQYLAYCKYTGLGGELAPAEGKWLMGAIHERLQKDPTHAGLSRLAMNVRYLNVPGYSPKIVRSGVQEEVEALHGAGKLVEAVEEAARARQAGVEVTGVLVEDRAVMVGAVVKRCRALAENNQWDKFARLRASAGRVWGHTALDEGAKRGLLKYFDPLRFLAEGHGKWEPYVVYAAEVRDLSNRDARLQEAKGKEISGEQVVEWLEQDLSPDAQHKARNIRKEAPDWQEIPQEPVVTGGFVRRFWGWLTGRRERRGRSSKAPTDAAA